MVVIPAAEEVMLPQEKDIFGDDTSEIKGNDSALDA